MTQFDFVIWRDNGVVYFAANLNAKCVILIPSTGCPKNGVHKKH